MPPQLASLLTWGFVIFLFRRDFREKPNVTGALWIPLIWLLITTTRAVSEWLSLFGFHLGGIALEEGSPLDAAVYYSLIGAGIYVLHRRQVRLSEVFAKNKWLFLFLIWAFISIAWSDFPFVAFKRWTKVIGHPIMVLILFTEPDPMEALTRLMKRCAYVIVPFSILFIKYYPGWGRGFSQWTGDAFNVGVTLGKNCLGWDCLILGFFFFWHLLQTWKMERGKAKRDELILIGAALTGIWWLLSMAQSSTSFMSLLLGVVTLILVGRPFVNRRLIGTYIIITVMVVVAAESTFGIYDRVLQLLHRDPTLTERTILWDDLFRVKINPVVGVGFESFWLGERRQKLWEETRWQPNEAHNGYLETYLNLGVIGLCLLVALLLATFRKVLRSLVNNFEFGRFRLGFLIAVIFYNWTESAFKALHPVWLVFYVIAMDFPRAQFAAPDLPLDSSLSESEGEFVYVEASQERV